jgi:hypothetical protein
VNVADGLHAGILDPSERVSDRGRLDCALNVWSVVKNTNGSSLGWFHIGKLLAQPTKVRVQAHFYGCQLLGYFENNVSAWCRRKPANGSRNEPSEFASSRYPCEEVSIFQQLSVTHHFTK